MRAEQQVVTVLKLELNDEDQKELGLILKLADKEATRLAVLDEVEIVQKWRKVIERATASNGRV